MPFYDYKCPHCQAAKEVFCGIKDKPEVVCSDCKGIMEKSFTADSVMSHVRGSTPGKAYKESKVRRKRNAELGVKQIERHGGATHLVPNVDGTETGSWREAALLAKDAGKDTAGFKAQAETEKNTQNSRGINEKNWKKAKEIARNVM